MTNPFLPTPELARSILRGEQEHVVWGGTESLTAHEWRRQLPASFFVDTTWKWWNKLSFHGKPVRSPSVLEDFDPSKTVIWHNYRYHAVGPQVPDFLSRFGGFTTLEPLSLQEIARIAAADKACPAPSLENSRRFIETVNEELATRLALPDTIKGMPDKETLAFLAGYSPRAYLEKALPRLAENQKDRLRPIPGRVCLCVGSISPGGAERQLCNLAIGLKRRGCKPVILCFNPNIKQENGAYLESLRQENVAIEIICPPLPAPDPSQLITPLMADLPPEVLLALWHVPGIFHFKVLSVYAALRRLRPTLFISYLDGNNIPGGFGALFAGVRHILLSARSTARPQLYIEPFLELQNVYAEAYRLLATCSHVTLSANSTGGAESYAEWTQIPLRTFQVVPNCVSEEFTKPLPACFTESKRLSLNLKEDRPFILGVFRLHPIKKPLDFVRVIGRLREKYPDLRAAICGSMDFEVPDIRTLIHELGLDDVLFLLGVASDIPALMQTATILLHTAQTEGSPNVVLEAQAMGLPVVAADNAGVSYCLHEVWKPLSREPGDIEGLADSCAFLLDNPEERKKGAAKAREETLAARSLDALAQNTLAAAMRAPQKAIPPFGPRKKIAALTGENENGALKTHARAFNVDLQRHGYETQLIDLLEPEGFSELSKTLGQRDSLAFVYAFAGVGSRFDAPTGGNLWTELRVPFVCFWYDPPAYNYKQHMVDSPYILHVYHVKDHYETRQRYLQTPSPAVYIPPPMKLPLNVHDYPWAEREKKILFVKTAYDPNEILTFWKTFPPKLCGVLERLAEQAVADRNINLADATAREFAAEGVPLDAYEDFFGIIHEVDRYVRAWRSDKLGRALLKYPARIVGRGWDYLADSQNKAEILPPVNGRELLPLIKKHRITANANPLWRDGLHERVWVGLGCGNVALTDRTERTDAMFEGLQSYVGFDWNEKLDEAIERSLDQAEEPWGFADLSRPVLRDYIENESSRLIERVEKALSAGPCSLPRS